MTGVPKDNQNVTYMLSQLEDVPYYEDDSIQMIQLQYESMGNSSVEMSMFVLLPKRHKSLEEVINSVSYQDFKDIKSSKMENRTVNVKLPKVSLRHRLNVKEVVETLQEQKRRRWTRTVTPTNNPIMMATDDFHLSGASSSPKFILTDFVQETVLEVNEKGTRAASITGGTINYDGSKKIFRADRPYVMIVYDNKNDIVLFWAAIYRPKNEL